ncbi:RNA polymerase sigma factor [Nonomuraea sp. GTA35]|uniref:RNA polymerase sigma factor n=1 Tax=Nonomuraea sp. GTA35 TaxID=1676746 RepID=UPI0035C07BCA
MTTTRVSSSCNARSPLVCPQDDDSVRSEVETDPGEAVRQPRLSHPDRAGHLPSCEIFGSEGRRRGSSRRRRFEELYTEHYGAVSAYVHRRTDRSDDTADVIAETFTTVWRRLGDVPRGDQARPWLYGVARRVLANHRRGESRRTALAQRLRDELAAWQAPTPRPGAARGAGGVLPPVGCRQEAGLRVIGRTGPPARGPSGARPRGALR